MIFVCPLNPDNMAHRAIFADDILRCGYADPHTNMGNSPNVFELVSFYTDSCIRISVLIRTNGKPPYLTDCPILSHTRLFLCRSHRSHLDDKIKLTIYRFHSVLHDINGLKYMYVNGSC